MSVFSRIHPSFSQRTEIDQAVFSVRGCEPSGLCESPLPRSLSSSSKTELPPSSPFKLSGARLAADKRYCFFFPSQKKFFFLVGCQSQLQDQDQQTCLRAKVLQLQAYQMEPSDYRTWHQKCGNVLPGRGTAPKRVLLPLLHHLGPYLPEGENTSHEFPSSLL